MPAVAWGGGVMGGWYEGDKLLVIKVTGFGVGCSTLLIYQHTLLVTMSHALCNRQRVTGGML